MHDTLIGLTLAADCKRPDEALPFLSESLLNHTVSLIQTAMGYFNVFFDKKDYRSAKDILHWEIAMLSGLKDHDTASFFDKMNSVLLVCLAEAELCPGDAAAARRALLRAGELAKQFDAAPGYHLRTVRFTAPAERASAYDDNGVTLLPLAASLLTGNRLQASGKRVSDRNRDFTAALTDCLSGFTVVKTFKAEKEIFQLFAQGRPMRSSAAAAAENPRC